MTLILSCATQEYVIQVSDRRLTQIPDYRLVDDNANKAVLFCGRMAFAYSGLAELEGKRTDLWLTDVLAHPSCQSLSDAARTIQARATDCFRHIQIPRTQKRHAFVGVGWAHLSPEEPFRPILCSISNFQDGQGKQLTEVSDGFTIFTSILAESVSFDFWATPPLLAPNEMAVLKRNLGRCVVKRAGPQSFIRLLADAIRKVSTNDRHETVGKNLLAISLPKKEVESSGSSRIVFPVARHSRSFLYIPAGESDGIFYGPNIVCGGKGALTGVTIGTLKDGKSLFRNEGL